jgi:hypothetical protein
MIFEFIILPGAVFLGVTLAAKLIERQRDVLYGPYIIAGRRDPLAELNARLALAGIGFRQSFARFTLKFATLGLFASAIIG